LALLLFAVPTAIFLSNDVDSVPMVAVADRLRPQQGWIKEGENITSRHAMLTDTRPGTMWRSWTVPQKVDDIDLEGYAKEAGYEVVGERRCEYNTSTRTDSTFPSCTLLAARDGFGVRLNAFTEDESHARLSLSVAFNPQDVYF
jgi:hypothetical protein